MAFDFEDLSVAYRRPCNVTDKSTYNINLESRQIPWRAFPYGNLQHKRTMNAVRIDDDMAHEDEGSRPLSKSSLFGRKGFKRFLCRRALRLHNTSLRSNARGARAAHSTGQCPGLLSPPACDHLFPLDDLLAGNAALHAQWRAFSSDIRRLADTCHKAERRRQRSHTGSGVPTALKDVILVLYHLVGYRTDCAVARLRQHPPWRGLAGSHLAGVVEDVVLASTDERVVARLELGPPRHPRRLDRAARFYNDWSLCGWVQGLNLRKGGCASHLRGLGAPGFHSGAAGACFLANVRRGLRLSLCASVDGAMAATLEMPLQEAALPGQTSLGGGAREGQAFLCFVSRGEWGN